MGRLGKISLKKAWKPETLKAWKPARLLRMALLCLCLCATEIAFTGSPAWEQVSVNVPQGSSSLSEEISVTSREGYIYVTTSRPVTVKVLTILGQLICEQQLPVGVSRLKVSARGIYILSCGGTTRRITI